MKNLTLSFVQRLKATNLLGQVSGNLERILPLSNVLESVRFSDEEAKEIRITNLNGGSMQTYEAPSPGWGVKEVSLEDAHASAFLKELDGYQGYQVADVNWLQDLKKQLGG